MRKLRGVQLQDIEGEARIREQQKSSRRSVARDEGLRRVRDASRDRHRCRRRSDLQRLIFRSP